ncbi:MAG: SHOCT domain-containing protein [Bacteroidales bacterium]|nr:SHOCT domain-containing protein [Bacteroidales bacterium]
MLRTIQLSIILALAALLAGCATVLTGTTQRVTVDSTPQGADIIIDGYMMGTTPTILRLDRDVNAIIDGGKDIRLELEGYYADGYYFDADIEPTTILNVFFPFGFALDAVSGAIMKYDSEYYNFGLIPVHDPENIPDDPDAREADDYEKLMKLVELYEQGLLTEEEYETEKARILDKNR